MAERVLDGYKKPSYLESRLQSQKYIIAVIVFSQ